MKRELAMKVMIKASVGGLLEENYTNRYNEAYQNTDDLSDKDKKSLSNCTVPLTMLHWAQHIESTLPYVMLKEDTEKYKKMFPDKDISELTKDENLEKFPKGRNTFWESTDNPFFMMSIDFAPDTDYESYMAAIEHLIQKKQELDKKYPNRLEELESGNLSEEEKNKRLLIEPRRDYKDKFWRHNGQKTITKEQYNKIYDSYAALLNKGFNSAEYVDSRAYKNLLEKFNINYDQNHSFDPLAAASDIIKADKTQKAEIMDSITEKKASEFIRALDMMNEHMDKCIADGKPETFADIKGIDIKVWFERCKIPPFITYDVESKIVKNWRGDKEIQYTKLEPNILEFMDLYNSGKFDPDLNSEFSQKDIDEVVKVFNTDKEFYTEQLKDLYRIKGDKNRSGGTQEYQYMGYDSLSTEERYKFNRFRSALFKVKLKDESVMKLGDDNNPIYTTKFTESDKDFEYNDTSVKETKMLNACKKMLSDARQKRNSKEYDNIQVAIRNMQDVVSDKITSEEKSKSVLYTEKVEEAIIAIGRYYAHKAADGETSLSTQHKYPVVQRIEKVLMDRYEALTGRTFVDDHPDMKDFYNTDKAVKDKKGNLLKGDEYVRSISKQRIKNVEKIRKDLKLGKSKLAEKTFNTKEQNEAETQVKRANSIGGIKK